MLRQALSSQQQSVREYAALARAQSEQINMVLQERYYRPLLSQQDRDQQTHELSDAAELSDVAPFPEETDRQQVVQEDSAHAALEKQLEEEFASIQAEHEAAHP